METLTRKLVEDTDAYRLRLDAELADHKKALAESLEQKEQVLEKQHQDRASELQVREQALQKLRTELDDRSARHARREQSRALQEKISDRSDKFTLTKGTQRKRLPIHLIFVVLLLVTGLLIMDSLFSSKTAAEGVSLWFELGRLPLSVVGLRPHRHFLYSMARPLVPPACGSGVQASTACARCRSSGVRYRDVVGVARRQGR